MKRVSFDEHQYIALIPYENNINFDFIDAIRARHTLQRKWKLLLKKLIAIIHKQNYSVTKPAIRKKSCKVQKCKISKKFRYQIACDAY